MKLKNSSLTEILAALIMLSLPLLVSGYALSQESGDMHKPDQHRHMEYLKMKNPIPMTEQSVTKGKELYQKHCVSCHGEAGRGGIGVSLADDSWLHGQTDGEIFNVISDGVEGTAMKGFGKELSEGERWHLVNYIKGLGRAGGKEGR